MSGMKLLRKEETGKEEFGEIKNKSPSAGSRTFGIHTE